MEHLIEVLENESFQLLPDGQEIEFDSLHEIMETPADAIRINPDESQFLGLELIPELYERFQHIRQLRRWGVSLEGRHLQSKRNYVGVDVVPAFNGNMLALRNKVRKADIELTERTFREQEGDGMSKQGDVYTVDQIVQIFGVAKSTFQEWVRSGKVPAHAVVARGQYKKSVIDKMYDDGLLTAKRGRPPKTATPAVPATKSTVNGKLEKKPHTAAPHRSPADTQACPGALKKDHAELVLVFQEKVRFAALEFAESVMKIAENGN